MPSPTAATRLSPPARGAHRLDALRDRPAEIVVGQRLRASCASPSPSALRAVDRGAVIEQPVAAVGGLDHLMHAEEAARGLDPVEAGLPERRSARRPARPAQRSAPAGGAAAASRRRAPPARSGTAVRPRPAAGGRKRPAPRRAAAAISERRPGLAQEPARHPPDQKPGQHQQRRGDQDRIFVDARRRRAARSSAAKIPPITPPSETHR